LKKKIKVYDLAHRDIDEFDVRRSGKNKKHDRSDFNDGKKQKIKTKPRDNDYHLMAKQSRLKDRYEIYDTAPKDFSQYD